MAAFCFKGVKHRIHETAGSPSFQKCGAMGPEPWATGLRTCSKNRLPVDWPVERLSGSNYPDRTTAQWDGMSCMAAPP